MTPWPLEGPHIRIELCDGTSTNITFIPIRQKNSFGAQLAAGEAFAWFMRGLVLDEQELTERLERCAS